MLTLFHRLIRPLAVVLWEYLNVQRWDRQHSIRRLLNLQPRKFHKEIREKRFLIKMPGIDFRL